MHCELANKNNILGPLLINSKREIANVYRKIYLFDVNKNNIWVLY